MRNKTVADTIICSSSRLEAIANRYVFWPIGTTSTSMKILRLIKEKKDITPRELMEYTGGTKSNITQRLNFLERTGLIERKYAIYSEDKRKVALKLTKAGKKKLADINKRLEKAKFTLENSFEPKELAAHYKFMEKLHTILSTKEGELDEIFNFKK